MSYRPYLVCFILGACAVAAGCSASEGDKTASSSLAGSRGTPIGGRLNDGGTPTDPGPFAIALASSSPSVNLGEKVLLDVTITPVEGFNADLELTVSGLPIGVTAAPVRVVIDPNAATTTATIAINAAVTSFVTPKDTTVPITITAKKAAPVIDADAGPADVDAGVVREEEETPAATATANFKVIPKVTLFIPKDVALLYDAPGGPLRAEWGEAFGPNNQPLRTQAGNGIVVSIFNNDTTAHIIHGPGGAFPHGDFDHPIQPSAFEMLNGVVRTRTLNVGDTAVGYVHGEPNSFNATFKIAVAATPAP
jgi:hypothetical protein